MINSLVPVLSGLLGSLRYFSGRKLCDMAPAFYAVRRGKVPGVYRTWDECKHQVHGFPNAAFKKFPSEAEAWNFVRNCDTVGSLKRKHEDENHADEEIFAEPGLDSMDVDSLISAFSSHSDKRPTQKLHVSSTSSKKAFYAVHRGHERGVYRTWTECEKQIRGHKNPSYKKFISEEEATEFVRTGGIKKLNRRQACRVEVDNAFADIEEPGKAVSIEDIKVDPEKFVSVFTDGASSKNGRVGAAAGIGVYWGPNHPLNASMRLPGRQTNNRAEIYAATHALRQAKRVGYRRVKLYTDSQFLINGITNWIKSWKKNGWKLANGEPVKNKDDFIELDKAREGLEVEFIHVKGHANIPGNVEADRLAVRGARDDHKNTEVYLV